MIDLLFIPLEWFLPRNELTNSKTTLLKRTFGKLSDILNIYRKRQPHPLPLLVV